MNLVNAILAESEALPPLRALGYEYVIAGNGLFIRAEDSRLAALIPIADDLTLHGLVALEPRVQFKLPKVPAAYLTAVLESARRHLPNEAMYQLLYDNDSWRITMPQLLADATPTALKFSDQAPAAIDLHSHGALDAFFSETDDGDEQGFRVYCVIGRVASDTPEIICRIGVYGHHMLIPADTVFEVPDAFIDKFNKFDELSIEGDEPGVTETESGLLIARYV